MAGLVLFDQITDWQNLLPFTFTRPVSDIRIGILKISEKWMKLFQAEVSYHTVPYLKDKYPLRIDPDNIILNSSILPGVELVKSINGLKMGQALYSGNIFVAARSEQFDPLVLSNEGFTSFKEILYTGKINKINYVWDIFTMNHQEIINDFELITQGRKSLLPGKTNKVFGSFPLFIESGAQVEFASLNLNEGPVYIGKDAEIMEGTFLRGPLAACEHSTIKIGAKIYTGTTIGPYCKVGGEINNSVFFGYSNKAHDGFIGNSIIGEWCNLGADTNNSNLKNNYENVKVWNYPSKSFMDTGKQFCGLFMGDHSKCSINTMFNTGTTVGAFVNIFGSGFPRTYIPSFSWGGNSGFTTYKLDAAIKTAQLVMQRRNIDLTDQDIKIMTSIFEMNNDLK